MKEIEPDITDSEIRILSLGLLLIIVGLFYLFDIIPASAQGGYGGGWGIYGPYGRPPDGAYDYPRNYIPPIYRPQPYGPQFDPCIRFGDCAGPGPYRRPMPMPRWGNDHDDDE